MKSSKQRRAELDAKKQARIAKAEAEHADLVRAEAAGLAAVSLAVKREALAKHNSYGEPDFVQRGYYLDLPFACVDCGKAEIWTAGQQKWWYEVAKGDVWTTARRCRVCRRREHDRRAEAKRAHQEGMARKQQSNLASEKEPPTE
jgi:hypothetical protein